VRLPVTEESPEKEGIVERAELLAGVYLAESLVRVDSGHAITSVLNTQEEDVELPNCEVQVIELEVRNREIARMGLTGQGEDEGKHSLNRTERLRTHNLKLQPGKCEFLRKEVNYLGHQITETGVRPDPQKVVAIEQFPTPTNTKQLKTFCGMISYYRRFIANCSKIASPLYKLLKRDAKFEWTEAQQNAFQHLKSKLISRPILQYPDFTTELRCVQRTASP
jgi:hypothetical protein